MLLTETRTATVEDYERLPEGAPYQLIGGELIMSPSPNLFHQDILTKLDRTLGVFIEKHGLGKFIVAPMDLRLGDHDVYQPDLSFVRKENVPLLDKHARLTVIPDLVIEILSPSTAYYDFTRKKTMYCEAGIQEYWIVDPEDETIEIMVKDGPFYRTEALLRKPALLESALFPGFSVKLEEIFAF
jgi:Uma2 family endonuclease